MTVDEFEEPSFETIAEESWNNACIAVHDCQKRYTKGINYEQSTPHLLRIVLALSMHNPKHDQIQA
jgi:hypothetical protein